MSNIIEAIQSNISAFDLIVFLIIFYTMIRSAAQGFMMSLLSFSKWLLALIITIILVPKFSPLVEDFIESKFISDVGLGIFIYILSLFAIINIGKAISNTISYSGLGSIDKIFGLIFGIFKGYVVCVCIFSLLNWFYPHKKWQIKTEDTYSFGIIYKGSEFLIEEFPNSEDYYRETEEKIEKI